MKSTELFTLSGKTALVTGCSRGIGKAMAVGPAKAGADIIGLSSGIPMTREMPFFLSILTPRLSLPVSLERIWFQRGTGKIIDGHSYVYFLSREHSNIKFVNAGRNGRKTSDKEELLPHRFYFPVTCCLQIQLCRWAAHRYCRAATN